MINYIFVLIPLLTFLLAFFNKKRKSVHFFIILSSIVQLCLNFIIELDELRFLFLLINNLVCLLVTFFLYNVYTKLILNRRARSYKIGRKYSFVFLICSLTNLIIINQTIWIEWLIIFMLFCIFVYILYMQKDYFKDIQFHFNVLYTTMVGASIIYAMANSLSNLSKSMDLKFILYIFTAIGTFIIGFSIYKIFSENSIMRISLYISLVIYGTIIISLSIYNFSSIITTLYYLVFSILSILLIFFVGENICLNYLTDDASEIKGVVKTNPILLVLIYSSILCVMSLPPFALFFGELRILNNSFSVENYFISSVIIIKYLILMFILFKKFMPIMYDKSIENANNRNMVYGFGVINAIIIMIILLGIFMPMQLSDILNNCAGLLLVK